MTIGIGFSTRQLPLSWIIRLLSKSRESHTWVYVKSSSVEVVYEASLFGFRKVSWSEFKSSNNIIKIIKPHSNLSSGVSKLESWLGKGYDYDELVGSVWVIIGKWFKRKFRNPFGSEDDELDCLQSVIKFLQFCKYPNSEKLNASNALFSDLEQLLKNEPTMAIP